MVMFNVAKRNSHYQRVTVEFLLHKIGMGKIFSQSDDHRFFRDMTRNLKYFAKKYVLAGQYIAVPIYM